MLKPRKSFLYHAENDVCLYYTCTVYIPAGDITFIQELLTISTLETYYLNFIASQL